MKIISSYVLSNKVYYVDSDGKDIVIPDCYVIIGKPQSILKKASSITIIPDDGIIITILIDINANMQFPMEVLNTTIMATFNELLIALKTIFATVDTGCAAANGVGGTYLSGTISAEMKVVEEAINNTFKVSGELVNMAISVTSDMPSEDFEEQQDLPVPSKQELKQIGKSARQKLVDTAVTMVQNVIEPIEQKVEEMKQLFQQLKEIYDKSQESGSTDQIKKLMDELKMLVIQQKNYLRNLSVNVQEVDEEEEKESITDEIV